MKNLLLTFMLGTLLLSGCSSNDDNSKNKVTNSDSQQSLVNKTNDLGIDPRRFFQSFNNEATKIGGKKLESVSSGTKKNEVRYVLDSDFYVIGDKNKDGKFKGIVTALIISDENRTDLVNKGETLVGVTSVVAKVLDNGNSDKVRDDKLMDLYNELFEDEETLKGENSKSMLYKNWVITVKNIPDLSAITFSIEPRS